MVLRSLYTQYYEQLISEDEWLVKKDDSPVAHAPSPMATCPDCGSDASRGECHFPCGQ